MQAKGTQQSDIFIFVITFCFIFWNSHWDICLQVGAILNPRVRRMMMVGSTSNEKKKGKEPRVGCLKQIQTNNAGYCLGDTAVSVCIRDTEKFPRICLPNPRAKQVQLFCMSHSLATKENWMRVPKRGCVDRWGLCCLLAALNFDGTASVGSCCRTIPGRRSVALKVI